MAKILSGSIEYGHTTVSCIETGFVLDLSSSESLAETAEHVRVLVERIASGTPRYNLIRVIIRDEATPVADIRVTPATARWLAGHIHDLLEVVDSGATS